MARLAVFASGNGTNFEAIAERLGDTEHEVSCLLCDRPGAHVLLRAERRGIPAYLVPYLRSDRRVWERAASRLLHAYGADFIALAGFMRLLTPEFVDEFSGRIVNVHPSLLPKYPGMGAIEQSYRSDDTELGVTVHYVDHGLDSGPILAQRRFARRGDESLEAVEAIIHQLEHELYPQAVTELLDACGDLPHLP